MEKNQIKVLVADDEVNIRNGLRKAVPWDTMDMLVVGMAKEGLEALEKIKEHQPDIVIVDIRMPNLDGISLIRKVREMKYETQFIILSGYDDFTYAQQAINYGVKAYLLKPLKMNELIRALKECLKEITEKQRYYAKKSSQIDYEALKDDSIKLFLNQLIQSDYIADENIDSKLVTLEISLKNAPIQVLVFETTNGSLELEKNEISTMIKLIKKALVNYSKEIYLYSKSRIIAIINTSDEDASNRLYHSCKRCLDDIWQQTGVYMLVGIGTPEPQLKKTFYSFTNALLALSYKLYQPDTQIYDAGIICDLAPDIRANKIDTKPLIEAVLKRDVERVKQFIGEFFSVLFYVPMPPPSYVKGMCIYLISDVQKNLVSVYGVLIDDKITSEAYTELGQLSSLTSIKEYLSQHFLELVAKIDTDIKFQHDQIIIAAKKYIDEHMAEKITAEEVATYVNLSVAYFTVYFKSKAGINFRDYLLNTKIAYAKRLLLHSKLSLSEIGSAVGYNDYRSFYRAFKNNTGITPSEFIGK